MGDTGLVGGVRDVGDAGHARIARELGVGMGVVVGEVGALPSSLMFNALRSSGEVSPFI